MMNASLPVALISTAMEHNKANTTGAAITLTGAISSTSLPLDEIQAGLGIIVQLVTIGVGITTMIVARYNFKKLKKKDEDQGSDS